MCKWFFFSSRLMETAKNKQWPQYVAVLTASLTLLTSGLHFGWPSPSVPKILSDEYPFPVGEEEASYIVLIGLLGDIVSSPLTGLVVDVIGRKATLLIIALPQITSLLMIYFSYLSPILLYAGRFLGGMAEGACFSVIPIYIGEVSEPKVRGLLGSYISVTLILGVFLSNVFGSLFSLHTAALVYTTVPICFFSTFLLMPESPYFLIMKNNSNKARESLRALRRTTDVEEELALITQDVKRQMSEKGSFRELITIAANRKACLIMIGIRSAQQFSGIAAFTYYAQVMFKEAMEGFSPAIASIVFMGTQLLGTWCTSCFVDKVGRKVLLIVSCLVCFCTLSAMSIYFILQDFTPCDVSGLQWLPLVGMMCYIGAFSVGLGTVVNLMPSELFSASIKAKAVYVMNMYYALTMIVSTKFFQYTLNSFGLAVPITVFACCTLLGLMFCYFYVPETKGKTLEDIQQYLKGNKMNSKTNSDEVG